MKSRIVKGETGRSENTAGPADPAKGSPVVKQKVASAREDARQIRGDATSEAEQLLEEARAEADRIREEARQAGYEEGIGNLNELAIQFQQREVEQMEAGKEEILRLAIRIAEKILGIELRKKGGTALTDIVTRAIRSTQHEGRIIIRANPEDLAQVEAQKDRILGEIGGDAEIEFREDRTMTGGGCIVETKLGIIDARLDTQLRVIEKALLSKKK